MKIRGIASIMALALLLCFTAGVSAAENTSTTELFEKGNQSLQQEKYGDAISAFKQVVELDPKDATAWFKLGGSYLQNGNFSNAYDAYQNATTVNPDYADAWAMIGYTLLYAMVPPDAAGALTALEKAQSSLKDDVGVIIGKLRNYGIRTALVCPPGTPRLTIEFLDMTEQEGQGVHFRVFETREAALEWLSAL